jgi:hypothetical protein
MLLIQKPFGGATVSDPNSGNINRFLENILVEVTALNYKQMMHEAIFVKEARLLDPPLRANERILSGLFGNAISTVAERSRPEVRIERVGQDGRIDYLAWYANRAFSIELKSESMSFESNSKELPNKIASKWKSVVKQAKDAQTCLRKRNKDDAIRYPNPVSISLMTVIAKRVANKEKAEKFNTNIDNEGLQFLTLLSKLEPTPQFKALYTFPQEFRCFARTSKGQPVEKDIYTPFVAFIARSNVNK